MFRPSGRVIARRAINSNRGVGVEGVVSRATSDYSDAVATETCIEMTISESVIF